MKIHSALHVLAAVLLLPLLSVRSAEPILASVTASGGEVQGDGPDGKIVVLGFDHEVITEGGAPGQAIRRVHKPLRIVKAIDKSSPLILKALVQNHNVTAEFRFYRLDANGRPQQHYTVKIQDARVAGVREWKTNTRDLSADRAGDLEEVSFVYHSITWTWEVGGIEFTDTWTVAE
jgi:type VI secretion system secreted protein Hcp